MTDTTIGEPPRPSGDRIDVLLVDDNEEWAELAASRIDRAAEDIDVSVAGSANEAVVRLQESDDIDCLVVDYKMPRVTGLELLERVREDYPRLPFLLITSEGSEEVAARAIDSGVTDYVVKDPAADQTLLFVSRIRSAVEQYRLRQAIEESEARYRTVTEQSRDALAILRRGTLVFGNQRLVEITGRESETLSGSDLVEVAIHPADRDRVRTVLDDWYGERMQKGLHEARIVQPDGTVRKCECTGRRITYDGEPAILVSIRDVTDRAQRERELQWERELNRTVQETLVESRTRGALEAEVAELLCQYGYALAWFGEQDGTALVPRTIEGDEGYVDTLDRSLESDDTVSEPSVWAARTSAPQFVQDFTELFQTDWREAADAAGYRSGAGLPLVYNDVTYGLLAVYHDRPDQFDETERHLLTELADTVALAIHSLETEQALTSDHAVTATVTVTGDAYYLVDLASDGAFIDFEEIHVEGTVPHDEETYLQYVTVDGAGATPLRETLETHPDVVDVVTVDEAEPGQLQVTVTGPVPEAHLAAQGVVVHSTTVTAEGVSLDIELPGREPVRSTIEGLEETFDDVSVLAVSERSGETSGTRYIGLDRADLTDKQAQALQAAYYHGYFDQPRGNTASAIATSLDVSHSTFLQHLHRAQQKVFQKLL